MNKFTWLAAALIGTGLVASSPSLSQGRYGGGSYDSDYSIRVSPDRDRYDSRYDQRRTYRDDDIVTGTIDTCRTVVTRREKGNGDIVTKRVRRC